MPTAISVRGLTRSYGSHAAVRDVHFEVATGECVAILGPNGAGKTTTIEILEGFRHRDGGTVSVLGVDPDHATAAWRSRLGIVAQSSSDLALARVREAIAYFATLYPNPLDTNELLEVVGLSDIAHQRIGQLSGGQRRRLDVALGLVGRPEVLFLDEPTTGFDPEARREFWQLISSLRATSTTVLLTTHYLDEAEALADRIIVIANGRTIADTTPGELGRRHQGAATVVWEEYGTLQSQVTDSPTSLILELAQRLGPEIPSLQVKRATLEDAYLTLIGESGE